MKSRKRIRRGDLVEVKSPEEILGTLDDDGALDHLPFMPEMIEHCGRCFRVSRRVVTTCCTAKSPRAFRGGGVFTLEGLRCSGDTHDGCQKACMIFWRAEWLRPIDRTTAARRPTPDAAARLRARLKTVTQPGTFFCQASELLKSSDLLSKWQRIGTAIQEVRVGNCSGLEMAGRLGIFLFWRFRRSLLGYYPSGDHSNTSTCSLNLQAGDRVAVQPLKVIRESLDRFGNNRGLRFSPDMRLRCDQQGQVQTRIDKIIVDGSGEMRRLRNTVRLEGSVCSCAHVIMGGCDRNEIMYWREVWLRRTETT
jgi:hypothetical protein